MSNEKNGEENVNWPFKYLVIVLGQVPVPCSMDITEKRISTAFMRRSNSTATSPRPTTSRRMQGSSGTAIQSARHPCNWMRGSPPPERHWSPNSSKWPIPWILIVTASWPTSTNPSLPAPWKVSTTKSKPSNVWPTVSVTTDTSLSVFLHCMTSNSLNTTYAIL